MAVQKNARAGRKRIAALKNLDLVYRAGTDSFASLFGLKGSAELPGKSDHDLLPSPVANVFQSLEKEVLVSGIPNVSSSRLSQTGSNFPGEQVVVRSPVVSDSGAITGLEINVLNVRELTADYQRLLTQGRSYQSLISTSPFALQIRRGNEVVFQNRRWLQLSDEHLERIENYAGQPVAEQIDNVSALYIHRYPVRWNGEELQAIFCFAQKAGNAFVEKRTGARREKSIFPSEPSVASASDEVESTLFKAISFPVVVCDNNWLPVYTNSSADELLASDKASVESDSGKRPGVSVSHWFNAREKVDIDTMLRRRSDSDPPHVYPLTIAGRLYSVSVSPTSWQGRSALLILLQHDLQQQLHLNRVQSELDMYKDFTAAGGDFQWEISAELKITQLSVDLKPLLGVETTQVVGLALSVFIERFVASEDMSDWSVLTADIRNRQTFRDRELKWQHLSGGKRVVRLSGVPVFNDSNSFVAHRGIGSDVTDVYETVSTMAFHASHDSLTGLVNRREFEQRCDRSILSARENQVSHALCFLDLDNFKAVNDTCGHLAGDELLRQLSTLFSSLVRKSDVLARLGGDEFGVLVYDVGVNEVMRLANQLRAEVESFQFLWEDNRFTVGVSIGVVIIDDRWEDRSALFRAADSACYQAKNLGRNRVAVYEDKSGTAELHSQTGSWVDRINSAIDENRVRLCMQPIYSFDRQHAQHAHIELLMRIKEQGRLISPGVFMPAADRYGLTTRLDRAVVERAIDWLEGQPHVTESMQLCSINLHCRSVADEEFTAFLIHALTHAGFDVSLLCFEIAETAVIANLSTASRFMNRLAETGCQFAIDDFGSGLSSFSYLKELPFDYLKIDGKYVRNILQESVDFAMVKAINEIGQVLGKKTIAEFVESDDVLEKLREMGVDLAQGYQIGKPELIDF